MKFRCARNDSERGSNLQAWPNAIWRRFRRAWIVFLLLCGLDGGFGLGDALRAGTTSEWSILDLNGQPVDPLAASAGKIAVLIFVKPDCPISNRYAPNVGRLQASFHAEPVTFWLVYPNRELTPKEIRKHVADYGYQCGVVRDPDHRLVNLCHARVTPEAAVFTSEGRLAYHGRIDDRYVAFGKWRPEATRHDLEEAIRAVMQGQPVLASFPAVGCTIGTAE